MKLVCLVTILCCSILASCGNSIFRTSLADRVSRSLVTVKFPSVESPGETNLCTGFIVSASKGQVLTATHCVPEDPTIEVFVNDLPSAVLKKTETLALLKIKPMTGPPLEIRRIPLEIGTFVHSFGFGHGKLVIFGRRVAALYDGDVALDGSLIGGMSGGPVVDVDGKVVGINQAVFWNVVGIACGQDEIRDFITRNY